MDGEKGRGKGVEWCGVGKGKGMKYLRDTLPVLAAVESRPCDAAGVLALEEEGFGFAVLEAEDLAVAADVEFALSHPTPCVSALVFQPISISHAALVRVPSAGCLALAVRISVFSRSACGGASAR